MSEIYHGETYDARLEKAGLDDRRASTIDSGPAVKVADHRKDDLIAPAGPPVRRIEELKPIEDLQDSGGRHGRRPGPEHGGLGPAQRAGPRGHDGHPPARRGPRQGRKLLHGEPAQGESDRCNTR